MSCAAGSAARQWNEWEMKMDHASFLRTICQTPDDDAPRLVYADYLDERGEPLGEFIRIGCELATIKLNRLVRPDRKSVV